MSGRFLLLGWGALSTDNAKLMWNVPVWNMECKFINADSRGLGLQRIG